MSDYRRDVTESMLKRTASWSASTYGEKFSTTVVAPASQATDCYQSRRGMASGRLEGHALEEKEFWIRACLTGRWRSSRELREDRDEATLCGSPRKAQILSRSTCATRLIQSRTH